MQQALAALADGRLPSSVYGVEHLLRLLLKLPELLGAAGAMVMGEEQLAATGSALQVGGLAGYGVDRLCPGVFLRG